MAEVKFCENNLDQGVDQIVERLQQEFDDVTVKVEPCLGYCGECAVGPFALVDEDFVQSDTAEELYDEIVERISK